MSAKLPLAFCLCVCFVSQSCLTLCSPMDCSPPGSSVHGIFQARLLEWDAISYSRGSSWPRDQADSLPLSLLWSPVSLGTALNLEISLRIDNCVFQSMNMINVFIFYLDSILFLLSLYMVFPLVVYRCESWTIKKAECWRTDDWSWLSDRTGEGDGTPLQYSCLENPMHGGAWWAAVCGVAKSWTRLSDFTFTFPFMHWRRKWQPTPVFLPGESQGWGA